MHTASSRLYSLSADLDNSGLINTEEELRGFVVNSWMQCGLKGGFRLAEHKVTRLLEQIEGGKGMSEQDITVWFETTIFEEFSEFAL